MSLSDDPRRNDEYGWIDKAAGRLLAAARDLIQRSEASRVSDEAVAQLMTAAIRLYVAKSDGEERTFRPIAGRKDEELTATELLSAVSELLRALRLGPMDLALWYRRRPDEDVYRDSVKTPEQARQAMNVSIPPVRSGRAAYRCKQSTSIPTPAISWRTPRKTRANAACRLAHLRHRRASCRNGVVARNRRVYRGSRRSR